MNQQRVIDLYQLPESYIALKHSEFYLWKRKPPVDKSNTENSIKKPNDAIYDSENQGKIEDLENESKKRIQILPVKSPQN